MLQKDDTPFIDLLNKIRVGNIYQSCETILKSRLKYREDSKYTLHVLHVFAENGTIVSCSRTSKTNYFQYLRMMKFYKTVRFQIF